MTYAGQHVIRVDASTCLVASPGSTPIPVYSTGNFWLDADAFDNANIGRPTVNKGSPTKELIILGGASF